MAGWTDSELREQLVREARERLEKSTWPSLCEARTRVHEAFHRIFAALDPEEKNAPGDEESVEAIFAFRSACEVYRNAVTGRILARQKEAYEDNGLRDANLALDELMENGFERGVLDQTSTGLTRAYQKFCRTGDDDGEAGIASRRPPPNDPLSGSEAHP